MRTMRTMLVMHQTDFILLRRNLVKLKTTAKQGLVMIRARARACVCVTVCVCVCVCEPSDQQYLASVQAFRRACQVRGIAEIADHME